MMTSTIRATLTLLLGGALLAACTSLPLPPAAPVAAIGTALLAIDVVNRHRSEVAPVMLELVVEDERGRQWRVTRAAETPATDAGRDFLFALELPPGRHRVRALAGRLRAGDDEGVLQHAVDIPFDVEAGRSRYLGRLSLENVARRDRRDQASGPPFPASAQHRFGLSDGTLEFSSRFELEEDLGRFRRAFPALPLQWVEPAALSVVGVERAPQARLPPLLLSFAEMDASLREGTAAPAVRRVAEVQRPSRAGSAAQQAWREFGSAPLPRAFALGDDGIAWGWAAARDDAWLVALDQCARRGAGCRIYALDDRVVARD